VKFWQSATWAETEQLCAVARFAEELGFEGLMGADHALYPEKMQPNYPYSETGVPPQTADSEYPDMWTSFSAMAAVTERIRFICSIYLLALRHPVLAAKSISTAAVMSQDRLILGVGAGWMREEFDLVGQAFGTRGRRLDESIDVLRSLLSGGMVEHHGDFYDFNPVQMSPVPDRALPIYGGGVSNAALRRAAILCDGWASEIQTCEELDVILERLRGYRAESDRADQTFGVCAALRDVFDLDGYRAMAERGVTELITVPWLFYGDASQTGAQKCDGIRRFADEVISQI